MCNLAMVWADYRKYIKEFGADIYIHEYARMMERVLAGSRMSLPKGALDAFNDDSASEALHIKELIARYRAQEATKLQEIFSPRKRAWPTAERVLAGPKPTKKATEDQRIASAKI